MNPIAVAAVAVLALGGAAGGWYWAEHEAEPCHAYRFGDEPQPGQAYVADSPCRSYNITCRQDYETTPVEPDADSARLRLVIENQWKAMRVAACVKDDLSVPVAVSSRFLQVDESLVLETRVAPGAVIVATSLDDGRAMQGTVYDVPRCTAGAYEIRLRVVADGAAFRIADKREVCTFGVAAQAAQPVPSGQNGEGSSGAWIAAGLAVSLGVAAVAWRWSWLRWALAGFFSRFAGPQVLEQETRARIHDAVRLDPGVHAEEIARRLGLASSQVRYHVGVLGRERLVTTVRAAGHVHVFPMGRFPPTDMRRIVAQRYPQWARVLEAVEAEPGATLGAVARRAGLSEPSASKVTRRLADLGLLRRRRVGRLVRHEKV